MHCSRLAVCLRATRILVLVAGTSASFLEIHPSEEAIRIDFRTASLRAAMGDVPHHKTVTFTDWKLRLGQVVPHSIAFDEGIEPRRRRLLDLERVPETPAERFQPPGTRP